MSDLQELKQQYFEAIYQTKSLLIRPEPFALKSGAQSHIYLNHRNFLTSSEYLGLIVDIYAALIQEAGVEEYQIATVDSIMSPVICGAMSIKIGRDIVSVRSNNLEHGTKQQIYGEIHLPCVVIDDMTSGGSTILQSAQVLRDNGALVGYAVVSACRTLGPITKLEKEGVKVLYIATFAEIVEGLHSVISEEEYDIATKEL